MACTLTNTGSNLWVLQRSGNRYRWETVCSTRILFHQVKLNSYTTIKLCVRKVAVRLGYGTFIWLPVSKLPLQCAVVSLYSAVKWQLKCNTGKVCNCLIQFLLTVVRGHHFQHLSFYKCTATFLTHCILKHAYVWKPDPTMISASCSCPDLISSACCCYMKQMCMNRKNFQWAAQLFAHWHTTALCDRKINCLVMTDFVAWRSLLCPRSKSWEQGIPQFYSRLQPWRSVQ
jgi:hypothetical protein